MKELTFKTGKVVKLCEDLYAPIPDGFKPATSEKGENANWKTIIPSGCSENENHIDLKPLSSTFWNARISPRITLCMLLFQSRI